MEPNDAHRATRESKSLGESASFAMARAVLAASRPHWSPEEAARRDYELLRLLATDPGAPKVYFRKLAVEASLAARWGKAS